MHLHLGENEPIYSISKPEKSQYYRQKGHEEPSNEEQHREELTVQM
jgi:hypothetical protein